MKRLWLWLAVWVWMAQACGPAAAPSEEPGTSGHETSQAGGVGGQTREVGSAVRDANKTEPEQPAYRPSCLGDEDCAEGLSCCQGECERRCSVVTQMDGTCAVHDDGTVWCWGLNLGGVALGPGHGQGGACQPVQIPGIGDAVKVVDGGAFRCVLHATGRVSCWGDNAHHGALRLPRGLSDQPEGQSPQPVVIEGLEGVVDLHAGFGVCAITSDWRALCWGLGFTGFDEPFFELPERGPFRDIAVDGRIWTRWIDAQGRLKGGHVDAMLNGHEIDELVALDVNYNSGCMVLADGGLICVGLNQTGQSRGVDCPFYTRCYSYEPIELNFDVVDAVYGLHSCVLSSRGDVRCAGANRYSQCGQENTSSDFEGGFSRTVDLGGVEMVEIERGDTHTCALSRAGGVYCWGQRPELTRWMTCPDAGAVTDIVKVKFNP